MIPIKQYKKGKYKMFNFKQKKETTATFQFKDDKLKLNIAGNTFYFQTNPETYKKIFEFKSRAGAMLKDEERADEVNFFDLCQKIIDEILGAGSFEKIFKNRALSINDCVDVTTFIIKELTTFNAPPGAMDQQPIIRS